MKDRILLINPEYNRPIQYEMYPSGAIAILKALAIGKGKDVRSIEMVSDRYDIDAVKRFISDFKPDLIGITFNTLQSRSAKEVTRVIKGIGDIPIIGGGAHISSLNELSINQFPDIDWFIGGEGEQYWLEAIQGTLGEKGFYRSCRFTDLDSLPMPDYGTIQFDKYTGAPPPSARPSMYMMASRGCPYQCIFCNKGVYGSHVRYKSPEVVVKEMIYLRNWGVREIFLQDDTLNVNHAWLYEILDRMNREDFSNVVFRAPVRANLADHKLLKRLHASNFWLLFYGVENGTQSMLDSIKKGLTIEQIKDAFKLTHESRIKTEASFIVGLPGETRETALSSFNLYKELKPHWAGFSPAIPFAGTEFTKIASEKGHILSYDYDNYWYGEPLVRTEEMTSNEILTLSKWFNRAAKVDKLHNTIMDKRTLKWAFDYVRRRK